MAISHWRRGYWPTQKEQPKPNCARISKGLQRIPDNGQEMSD